MLKHLLLFISVVGITEMVSAQNNVTVKFNNTPFTTGSDAGKTSFKSSDFIYARADLGKTVKEYFKIDNAGDATTINSLNFTFKMEFTDARDGKNYASNFSSGSFIYVKPEDLAKTYINFDIVPDPSTASTVLCMVRNFKGGLFSSTVYNLDLKQYKNDGKIKITIRLAGYKETYPGSGYTTTEGMPKVTGEFEMTVNHADNDTYIQNSGLADKKIASTGLNLSSLPPIFSKPFKTTDPKLTTAKLTAILKRDYPYRKVLKMALDSDGGQLWLISKNDFGIPKYRYFNGILHVAYMENGVCKVGSVELIENYLGGGKYAPLAADYWSEYDRQINCAAVK